MIRIGNVVKSLIYQCLLPEVCKMISILIVSPKMKKAHKPCIIKVCEFSKLTKCNVYVRNDTGGRGRTDTPKEHDFESCASANSATPA